MDSKQRLARLEARLGKAFSAWMDTLSREQFVAFAGQVLSRMAEGGLCPDIQGSSLKSLSKGLDEMLAQAGEEEMWAGTAILLDVWRETASQVKE